MPELDFLDVGQQEFDDIGSFSDYVVEEVESDDFEGKLSIIGSIAEFNNKDTFVSLLEESGFNLVRDLDNLLLLRAGKNNVPYYVHLNSFCPVFLTTGTKTEDQSETIDEFLHYCGQISRMWVGKQQMERIRQDILDAYDDVRIPYFTAHHSPSSDDDVTRSGVERTIQYYGDDGHKTFKEMRDKYGVFPTNIQFESPNRFKFRMTEKGVFTINSGEVSEPFRMIRETIDRLREAKSVIKESAYNEVRNDFDPERTIPESQPWGIQLHGLKERDVRNFKENAHSRDWDFKVSKIRRSYGENLGLRTELTDTVSYGKAALRTKNDLVRVFPRKRTTFSHFMRIYSFVHDHIDHRADPIPL